LSAERREKKKNGVYQQVLYMTTETFLQLLVIVLFDNFWVIIAFFEEIIY